MHNFEDFLWVGFFNVKLRDGNIYNESKIRKLVNSDTIQTYQLAVIKNDKGIY